MSDNEAKTKVVTWAGPVARAYGLSRDPVAVCIGPTGGGKTTESVRRTRRIAQWQHPSPRDGLRKGRTTCIAPTYRRIWDQVIPSYLEEVDRLWGMKPDTSGFKGARGDPADHVYLGKDERGLFQVEVMFRAVGDLDLEEFFRGLASTAFWLPELDTHESESIFDLAANRAGRYPMPSDRPELEPGMEQAYFGVYGDANAPVIGSWAFKRFYVKRREGEVVFKQPGGLLPGDAPYRANPRAENLQNLRKIDPNFYANQAKRMDKWAVRRLLQNLPGYSRHGQPVHEDFDINRMVLEGVEIPAEPDIELVIGADCGNTLWPSAVFLQFVFGQVRQLAEVAPMEQMDINEFGVEIRRIKDTLFPEVARARLVVDPSANARPALNRQLTYAQVLQATAGIEVQLAATNDPLLRRTALNTLLKRAGPPGEPGFVMDRRSPETVAALAGGYMFELKNGKVAEVPKKNIHSHRAEAAQYGALAILGPGAPGGLIHGGGAAGDYQDHAPILPD